MPSAATCFPIRSSRITGSNSANEPLFPMKFAVLRFPGSNCDQDCFHASARRHGLGHRLRLAQGNLARRLRRHRGPRRFFLRRLPAHRGHRALLARDGCGPDGAAGGKLVIGVCNGFQILCESGLLPGALIRNRSLRFVCEEVASARGNERFAVHQRDPDRHDPAHAGRPRRGLLLRRRRHPARARNPRQVLLRYVDAKTGAPAVAANPNGSRSTSRAFATARATFSASCPTRPRLPPAPRQRGRQAHLRVHDATSFYRLHEPAKPKALMPRLTVRRDVHASSKRILAVANIRTGRRRGFGV